jgi:hypothetical protein
MLKQKDILTNEKPEQFLVIEIGNLAGCSAKNLFDDRGILRQRDYLLFNYFDSGIIKHVTPGIMQLVFVSDDRSGSAESIAAQIKAINDMAIVIAFSPNSFRIEEGEKLDAVIATNEMNETDPAELVVAFKEGVPRDELVQSIEDFGDMV